MTDPTETDSTLTPHAEIDVDAILAARRQVAVIWSIEGVQTIRPDLDDDQSWEVLQSCRRAHDCEIGFTWDLIRIIADDLFSRSDGANRIRRGRLDIGGTQAGRLSAGR